MKILRNTFRRGTYFSLSLVYNKIEVFKMKRLIKKKYSKETLQKICDFVKNKNKFNFKTAGIDKDTVKSIRKRVENLFIFIRCTHLKDTFFIRKPILT